MAFEDLGTSDRMASMRTSMAFQRTRMAADRTLMAVLRTSLSMIGFGFTIYNFFKSFVGKGGLGGTGIAPTAPGRFGLALVVLGTLLLVLGMINHYHYMRQLRDQRADFIARGLMPGTSIFPPSLALIAAFALLLIGVVAIGGMMLGSGPLG